MRSNVRHHVFACDRRFKRRLAAEDDVPEDGGYGSGGYHSSASVGGGLRSDGGVGLSLCVLGAIEFAQALSPLLPLSVCPFSVLSPFQCEGLVACLGLCGCWRVFVCVCVHLCMCVRHTFYFPVPLADLSLSHDLQPHNHCYFIPLGQCGNGGDACHIPFTLLQLSPCQ
jgi:hypothetical protein